MTIGDGCNHVRHESIGRIAFSSVLILALGLGGCQTLPGEPEPVGGERVESRDTLSFPDTPAGHATAAHIETIYATGEDATARYEESLAALRELGDEVVPILVTAYDETDGDLYGTRWALLQTLADIRIDAASADLLRIANDPVPDAELAVGDLLNPREEEALLRMTAIQGLAHAAASDRSVAAGLGKLADHEVLSVSEEALRALQVAHDNALDKTMAEFIARLIGDRRLIVELEDQPVPVSGASPGLQPADHGASDPPQGPQ